MNGQPLRYAVLAQADGRRFFWGSHTSIERARAMIHQDLRPSSPVTKDWIFWIVELDHPHAVYANEPLADFKTFAGPYSGSNGRADTKPTMADAGSRYTKRS